MNQDVGTGFYHRTYQFIKRYLLTEGRMFIACTIAMIAGATLAIITAVSLDPSMYAVSAEPGARCV